MNNNINTINLTDNHDLYSLDQFFKKQFKGDNRYGTMGYFYWKIKLNPTKGGYILYIKNEKSIVATTSITFKKLYFLNKVLITAEIGDTYTDSKFQGRGFFNKLVNNASTLSKNNNVFFLYGTPNNQSLPAYLKSTDFTKSSVINLRSFTYFLDLKSKLKPYIGNFLSTLINIFYLTFEPVFFYFNQFFIYTNLKISDEFEPNNDMWENFWKSARNEWDFIFSRDKENFDWRFQFSPDIYKILLVKKDENIVGYLVYKIVTNGNNQSIIIADFLFLNDNVCGINMCLNQLRKYAKHNNINYISSWCENTNLYSSIFSKMGFIKGKKIEVIINNLEHCNFENIKKIHFTISDTDNI